MFWKDVEGRLEQNCGRSGEILDFGAQIMFRWCAINPQSGVMMTIISSVTRQSSAEY